MTARAVTPTEFELLIRANPEAQVDVDHTNAEYRIRTATGREYRTAFGDPHLAGRVEQRQGRAS